MSQPLPIHEEVQKRYGSIASQIPLTGSCCSPASADTSCCSPGSDASAGCDCGSMLYNVELLEGLPESVTALSLGCGDPVTIASLKPGEVVLDLGSGGGIDCFMAARQVGSEGRVIGIDMTPQMLEKANANKVKLGASNVEFREGYIEAIPVDDSQVDVIMSNCVINLSPDKPAVFREAFRVLKSGGRLAISDIVIEGEFSEEARKQMDLWAACVSGAVDVADYIHMMVEAGFVDIVVKDKAEPTVLPAVANGTRIYSARITARKP
jgi:arsenite methyltransferase